VSRITSYLNDHHKFQSGSFQGNALDSNKRLEVPDRRPYSSAYTPRSQLVNIECPQQKKSTALDYNQAHRETKCLQAKSPITLSLEKEISIVQVQDHDSPNCIYLWPRERSDQDHDPCPIHKGGDVKNLHVSSFRQVGNLRHGYGDCDMTEVIISMMLHIATGCQQTLTS
jgi:hypothetical protein